MPKIGLEPTHHKAQEPKSCVSTNFTTWACTYRKFKRQRICCQPLFPLLQLIALHFPPSILTYCHQQNQMKAPFASKILCSIVDVSQFDSNLTEH